MSKVLPFQKKIPTEKNIEDKQMIQLLCDKIREKLKDRATAKKAALIIERMLGNRAA